jgi:hypothetical protein
MHVDFDLKNWNIDSKLPVSEICSKLEEMINSDGDQSATLLEMNDSDVVVTEIKPGEEE